MKQRYERTDERSLEPDFGTVGGSNGWTTNSREVYFSLARPPLTYSESDEVQSGNVALEASAIPGFCCRPHSIPLCSFILLSTFPDRKCETGDGQKLQHGGSGTAGPRVAVGDSRLKASPPLTG